MRTRTGARDRAADGFYWEARKGEAHGPFATRVEAEADLLAGGAAAEEDLEVPEALQEAESELGINEWIDPDTGGPAEITSPHRRPLIARTPLLACCAGIVAWSAATAQPALAPNMTA